MSEIKYNLNFEKLCTILQLGELIGSPEELTGGLLHRMYVLETSQGKYAVKALNPQIMIRTTALQNIIKSEIIVNIASRNVPALPARQFNGNSVQQIDNQCYLIFDWIEGRSLKSNEISIFHCEKMGEIIADIHMTDFSEIGTNENGSNSLKVTDWNFYLQQGQLNDSMWINLVAETIEQLYDWNAKANNASKLLASNTVISHGDLDSKNVLWNQGSPILIDWEASGHINPMQNLIETAIYWSENETGKLDRNKFLAFLGGYKKKCGTLQANWKAVLENGFIGMLGWLEYSLKRSLWIECTDEKEQQMGTEQVTGTINALRHYAERMFEIEQWLNDESLLR
ncbi:phosphotransferase [Paenibacillus terrigena]|uniref:phosphotransferase enzyme family protein n=1 Tax=Paenibacillus terrigena TaxID=369333 RepID=UPI0028D65E60|nr:phosphotransferase [Paenibacillus terrigena]